MIHCSNPACRVANERDRDMCKSCHWPLVRRYLWAIGSTASALEVGTVLASRYEVIKPSLLLDLDPAESPLPVENPAAIALPFLHLAPFHRSIPRPFTQVVSPHSGEPLLLLEDAPLKPNFDTAQHSATPMPTLPEAWPHQSALHQLSWLWQIARLWQPLRDESVATSLLLWNLVRVDGEDVRLLSLQHSDASPSLADLGQRWRALLPKSAPEIRSYLTALTEQLMAQTLSAEGLLQSLTHALETLTATATRSVEFATFSDQGPTRQRNEDACYPPSGTVDHRIVQAQHAAQTPAPIIVVCDGIGGHQGGDVASNLAIEVVTRVLNPLAATPNLTHAVLVEGLQRAVLEANRVLSARNDQDQRRARDRMGTTLVVVVVYGARLYLAHLGDSRAYRIRPHSCRQLTLDDDVAARDSRLGYRFYRDALGQSGAGALVQALGMGDSQFLHPTVEMYPLIEDGLFLLCSDGLSDNDLVERLWQTELRSAVQGSGSVEALGKRLIRLANTHNGHDNVTVSLIRVTTPASSPPLPTLSADIGNWEAATGSSVGATAIAPTRSGTSVPGLGSTVPPQTVRPPRSRRNSTGGILRLLWLLLLVGILGGGGWLWRSRNSTPETVTSPPSGSLSPDAVPPGTGARPLGELAVGDVLQIQVLPEASNGAEAHLLLGATPPGAEAVMRRSLPVGTVVEVMTRQTTPDDEQWVQLRVCQVPALSPEPTPDTAPDASPPSADMTPRAQPGDEGWIRDRALRPIARQTLDTSPTQQGMCMDTAL
ncbi:MAG: protein phosphatase 2C domain-containing protein [Leptolyngbyaceae cyanobacterium T60_A2020_046]|nr:protein phosphatase 2C domain-containing protein [Leptolyngbyaceae cyanobacterium T60_A2020_046]